MKRSELKKIIREAVEEINPTMPENDTPEAGMEEGIRDEAFGPDVDEVGTFFITEMPSLSSTIEDIVIECKDIAYFANQIKGGLKLGDVMGVFKTEAKAKKLGEKLLAERDKKKTEAKQAGDAYKKMKEEALAKVQEYMKNKKATKAVVDELKTVTK